MSSPKKLILRCASDTYKLASREIGGVRCSSLDFPHLEIQGEKRVLRLELLQKGGLGGFLFRREALILCSRRNIPTWSFGREKSVCVDENCHFCLCGRASKLGKQEAGSQRLQARKNLVPPSRSTGCLLQMLLPRRFPFQMTIQLSVTLWAMVLRLQGEPNFSDKVLYIRCTIGY